MRKHLLMISLATMLIALPLSLLYFFPAWAADCSVPPFLTSGVQSNVLVIMDNSMSMGEFAYKESLEMVAKPHKHFFNVTMTQASWKKATNILI